jgi:hypothetical protein
MKTLQESFDTVVTHLLTQNARSWLDTVGTEGGCAYRGENGMKCAVGCLIDDKEYSPDLENLNSYASPVQYAISRSGYLSENDDRGVALVYGALQCVHDTKEPKDWEKELKRVAKAYKLKFKWSAEGDAK